MPGLCLASQVLRSQEALAWVYPLDFRRELYGRLTAARGAYACQVHTWTPLAVGPTQAGLDQPGAQRLLVNLIPLAAQIFRGQRRAKISVVLAHPRQNRLLERLRLAVIRGPAPFEVDQTRWPLRLVASLQPLDLARRQ